MPTDKKYLGDFANGGGDYDSAPFAIGPNKSVNMENCRIGTTDAGETGTVESIGSTILIPNPYLPAGENIEIESAIDDANARIVSFNWNSNGDHAIFAYYCNLKSWFIVLLNSQVTGGLNFDKNQLIHSARIINFCVYWVNYLQNQPRRMNIEAGIKLNHPSFNTSFAPYTSPLTQSVIAWARRQPGLPPSQVKVYQTSPVLTTNFIATEAFLFAYRYVYRDYEISTLSGYSTLANYNYPSDQFNRIDITLPLQERIDQDVIQVDLVAIFLNTGQAFIVQSWRTIIPSDLVAIQNHNNGTSPLTYPFYNNQIGIALDAAYVAKEFDSIPLFAKTDENAKNRSLIGNHILGYDTPTTTSLTAIPVTQTQGGGGGGTVTGEWFYIYVVYTIADGPEQIFSAYIIRMTTLSPAQGYYAPFTLFPLNPTIGPPFPPSVDFSTMNFLGTDGNTAASVLASAAGAPDGISSYTLIQLTDQSTSVVITGTGGSPVFVNQLILKSDNYYNLSVSFMDNYGAKCGVISPFVRVQIPDRVYNQLTYYSFIDWVLSNANALNEIPDWAFYYSIDITKSQRTRFFLQARGKNITYATKDADNNYVFDTSTYDISNAGIAVDISLIFPLGLGYSFSLGDIIKIYTPTQEVSLAIIDQSAQYVICQLADLGAIGNQTTLYATFIFEIYTPYKAQSNEPLYEVSQIFPIANPGTNARTYSIISGQIEGDAYLITRTDAFGQYLAEAMNPNDKFYKQWFTDTGRPNFIDYIGQVDKQNSIAYSNTFIPGSKTNGLSTFDALDTQDVFPECGAISKLQLSSKVEGQLGNVLLAICEQETASLYLSETQMVSAVQNEFLAQSSSVIGTINVLKGSFGTAHPESVVEFRGNIFFWSEQNGQIVQYSSNGLFPISNYKATRFWKLFSEQFLSMTQSEIEALGSRPFVFMCVDSHNWELLVTIPKLLEIPPKGYLPDYPEMIYPFDIWDGQAKTIVYKLNAEPNFWQGAYNHTPEGMVSIQNKVYGFKNGQMYQHGSISDYLINIYGVTYKARIMVVSNVLPNTPKTYDAIGIEGNLIPSLTYFRTEPNLAEYNQYDLPEQASDLVDFDYTIKEGEIYATILRNKLVPTATGLDFNGLLTAERIRAITLKILIEFTPPITSPLELRFITLDLTVSRGHGVLMQKT